MSGRRHLRFTLIDNVNDHSGAELISRISKKPDQLRSAKSARRSFRAKLNSDEFYSKFRDCLNGHGSAHGIGFPCALMRESAACLPCSYRARAHIFDMLSDRSYFSDNARFLTILDLSFIDSRGYLDRYNHRRFIKRISEIARPFKNGLHAFAKFEMGSIKQPYEWRHYWSPHFHIIIDGKNALQFADACAREFNKRPEQTFLSKMKEGTENRTLFRRLGYITKSPHARRSWKFSTYGAHRLDLDKYLDRFNCSDLIWHTPNIRFSAGRRIELSSLKDIATAQIRASTKDWLFNTVLLRKVRKQTTEEKADAEILAERLQLTAMLDGRESTLLSSSNVPKHTQVIKLAHLKTRLRRLDGFYNSRKGNDKSP